MSRLIAALVAGFFAAALSLNAGAAKHMAAEKAGEAKPAAAKAEEPRKMTEEEKKKAKEEAMKKDAKK